MKAIHPCLIVLLVAGCRSADAPSPGSRADAWLPDAERRDTAARSDPSPETGAAPETPADHPGPDLASDVSDPADAPRPGADSPASDTGGRHGSGGRGAGGSGAGGRSGSGGAHGTGGKTGSAAAGGSYGGASGRGGAPGSGGATRMGDGGIAVDGGRPSWWQPSPDSPIHWHWQLSQEFSASRDVLPHKTVFDIDGELTSSATVAALHALGPEVKVICYFDAGVYESYRSDASRFPSALIGKADVGWNDSYWLDIRQLDILMPILRDRMVSWCKNKGFDAVEPDETEVWSNDSGFPITKADNAAFHKALSEMAHALDLSIGLKGNNTEAVELEPYFDWALTEQCWEYDECTFFRDGFVARHKAVFNVEYDTNPNCTLANQWHINSSRRDLDLVGPTAASYLYQPCVPDDRSTW